MVECRSPKPNVEGSSPSWPVLCEFLLLGDMMKVANFFKESFAELKKVVWPSFPEVLSSLKLVLVSTLLIAVFLGLVDALFVAGIDWLF
jgi:preprotein translocase, secE subunit